MSSAAPIFSAKASILPAETRRVAGRYHQPTRADETSLPVRQVQRSRSGLRKDVVT